MEYPRHCPLDFAGDLFYIGEPSTERLLMILSRVQELAEDTRRWAERLAEAQGFPDDLCGLCGFASAKLLKQLRAEKIPAQIAIARKRGDTKAHCFVEVPNYIVDVTATQFDDGYLPVQFIEKATPKKKLPWHWKARSRYKTVKGLILFMQRESWYRREVPTLDILEKVS